MFKRPVITNVIGAGELQACHILDLQYMASKMEGSRLNLKKFPGLIIRKSKPKGTIILFKSKKFIIVGAQDRQDCQLLSRKITKDVQKILNISEIKLKMFKISNIIANAHLGYQVNIARIAQLPNAIKDDKSSGVYIRMDKVKCVVVFQSGKMILNGATNVNDIEEIFDRLQIQLQAFISKRSKYIQENEDVHQIQDKTHNCKKEQKKKRKKRNKNKRNSDLQENTNDNDRIQSEKEQCQFEHTQHNQSNQKREIHPEGKERLL